MKKEISKNEPYFANYTTIDAVKSVVKDNTEFQPYVCTKCDYSSKWIQNLNRHLQVHSDYKQFSCSYCDRKFKRKANLDTHEEIHRGDRQYECPKCPKKFVTKDNLCKHQRFVHALEEEKLYTCSYPNCGKSFALSSFLKRHFKDHAKIKPHACSKCPTTCVSKSHLRKHLLVHERHEAKMTNLTCAEVKPETIQPTQTQQNFSTGEKQAGRFYCSVCPNGYKSKSRLDKHTNKRGHFEPVSIKKEVSNFLVKVEPDEDEGDYDDDGNIHECPICLECFKKFTDFEKHYQIHVMEGTQL